MSDVCIISWPVGEETYYGLVTDESYPKVFGYGNNLDIARAGKRFGADFVNTLGVTDNLNSLEEYEEVEDE